MRLAFNNWSARVVCKGYEEPASRNWTGAWVEMRSGPGSPIGLDFGTQFWSIPGSTNWAETGSTISLFPVPAFGQMRFPLFPKVGTHCSAISGSTFSLFLVTNLGISWFLKLEPSDFSTGSPKSSRPGLDCWCPTGRRNGPPIRSEWEPHFAPKRVPLLEKSGYHFWEKSGYHFWEKSGYQFWPQTGYHFWAKSGNQNQPTRDKPDPDHEWGPRLDLELEPGPEKKMESDADQKPGPSQLPDTAGSEPSSQRFKQASPPRLRTLFFAEALKKKRNMNLTRIGD